MAAVLCPDSASSEVKIDPFTGTGTTTHPFAAQVKIVFASPQQAVVAYNSLSVDKELNPEAVERQYVLESSTLKLSIRAVELRTLRVAISSFLDMAKVVAETIDSFGS